MTMPMERARALRFAHEVLTLVRTREDVPEDLRYQALVTLRHLPQPHEIAYMAQQKVLNWWIEPEQCLDKALDVPFDEMLWPEQYQASLQVWTSWLEFQGANDVVSTFVVIGYCRDEQLARAMFAGRFGIENAKLAQFAPGVVANEVTERLISPAAFEAMTIDANDGRDFCVYVRQDRQLPAQQSLL